MAYTINWDMVNSLVAPTYVQRIKDQFFFQNAAYYRLRDKVEDSEEGPFIVVPISYDQEGGGGGWYAGSDKFDTRVRDPFQAATFFWKNAHVPSAVTGDQELAVTGPRAVVKLVSAKMKVLESTMIHLLGGANGLFNDGSDPKAMTGLQHALKDTVGGGTTVPSHQYGGITASSSSNSWWVHQMDSPAVAYTTGPAGTYCSGTGGFQPWEKMLGQIGLASDKQPTLVFCNWGVFRDATSALIKNERYGRPQQDSDLAKVGFKNILFKDMPVVVDRQVPRDSATKKEKVYFIDERCLKLYVHPARNMHFQPWARPIDQDARIAYLFHRVELVFDERRSSGVQSNVDTTNTS